MKQASPSVSRQNLGMNLPYYDSIKDSSHILSVGPASPNRRLKSGLHKMIAQYLGKQGLYHALQVFEEEVERGSSLSRSPSKVQGTLLGMIDRGKREEFFQVFDRLLPAQKTMSIQKLSFYLMIYFSLWPVHPCNPNRGDEAQLSRNMQILKNYLSNSGAQFAKTTEFLQFYALPYIQRPQEHQSFRHFFSIEWQNELKHKVQELVSALELQRAKPKLLEIYQKYENEASSILQSPDTRGGIVGFKEMKEKLSALEVQHFELLKREEYLTQTLIDSQAKWTKFSQNIVHLAKRIYAVKASSDSREQLDQLNSKLSEFEEFLSSNRERLETTPPIIPQNPQQFFAEDASHRMATESSHMRIEGEQKLPELNPIDFSRIKYFFLQDHDEEKTSAVIQALQWRLSRYSRSSKRDTLTHYIQADILGCHSSKDYEHTALKCLFTHSRKVLEFTMSFLNTLSSKGKGRTYLLQCDSIIEVLVKFLHYEVSCGIQPQKEDSTLRQNALGTLQKLSLSRVPQTIMIQLELVSWLLNLLNAHLLAVEPHYFQQRSSTDEQLFPVQALSEYSLEYASALLLNLCLRRAGKAKCELEVQLTLSVTLALLHHSDIQVRTFINGIMYSLLDLPLLKQRARSLNLKTKLELLLEESQEDELKRQLQYILDKLEEQESEEVLGYEEDDDFQDEEESEEDEGSVDVDQEEEQEPEEDNLSGVFELNTMLKGEALLLSLFAARTSQQSRAALPELFRKASGGNSMSSVMQRSVDIQRRLQERPINRPISPFASSQSVVPKPDNIPQNKYTDIFSSKHSSLPLGSQEEVKAYEDEFNEVSLPNIASHILPTSTYGQRVKGKRVSKFTIPETESSRAQESSQGQLPNHSSLVAAPDRSEIDASYASPHFTKGVGQRDGYSVQKGGEGAGAAETERREQIAMEVEEDEVSPLKQRRHTEAPRANRVETPLPREVKDPLGLEEKKTASSRDILTPNTVEKLQAFQSRDKLLRTPPQQVKKEYLRKLAEDKKNKSELLPEVHEEEEPVSLKKKRLSEIPVPSARKTQRKPHSSQEKEKPSRGKLKRITHSKESSRDVASGSFNQGGQHHHSSSQASQRVLSERHKKKF